VTTLASDIRRAVALLRARNVRPGINGFYYGYASRGTLDLLVGEIGRGGARMDERDGPLPFGVYLMFEGTEFYLDRIPLGYFEIEGADAVPIQGGGPVYD
jgi:hypothetical protein